MIDVDYNEYKETIAQNMKLIIENHDLKEEVEKLKCEKEQLNNLVNFNQKEIRRLNNELQTLKMSEEECLDKSLGVDKNEKTS